MSENLLGNENLVRKCFYFLQKLVHFNKYSKFKEQVRLKYSASTCVTVPQMSRTGDYRCQVLKLDCQYTEACSVLRPFFSPTQTYWFSLFFFLF